MLDYPRSVNIDWIRVQLSKILSIPEAAKPNNYMDIIEWHHNSNASTGADSNNYKNSAQITKSLSLHVKLGEEELYGLKPRNAAETHWSLGKKYRSGMYLPGHYLGLVFDLGQEPDLSLL